MTQFIVSGNRKLQGEVEVFGAKNGILPMMAASLLTRGETIIHNVPDLRDVYVMSKILETLGAKVDFERTSRTLIIDCRSISNFRAPYEWVKQMRASFLVIGSLLARCKEAEVPLPGGCAIGTRSIDFHLKALHELGASIIQEEGIIKAKTNGLVGITYHFDFPTHTGTENIMIAACLAQGTTTLVNSAREPEVVDLANFLNSMGAKISGAGTSVITIEGVQKLSSVEYTMAPSRIDTGFFMIGAAITKGELIIKNALLSTVGIVVEKLRQTGVEINELPNNKILVRRAGRLDPVDFITQPFPGFPTDLQPQMMALLTLAQGVSIVRETLFEKRFMHVEEMNRLGANIKMHADEAIIRGPAYLNGAPVTASDLQAGAGLLLLALAADGDSVIDNIYHIDRGYEQIEFRLNQLGALIERKELKS